MMLAEALAAVVPDIDPVLASPAARGRVLKAGSGLGDDAIAAYIECRADPGDDRTDLLACFLSTADPQPASTPEIESGPRDGWSLAAAVQLARRTDGNALHGNSPLIWLEFDDAGSEQAAGSPSVCVCLEPGYLARNRWRAANPACEAMATTVASLAAVDEATGSAVVRCIRALPAEGRAIHLSLMCARIGSATKLYERVPLRSAPDYLARIGWDGDRAGLQSLLDWREPDDAFVHLDLSIEKGLVLPRLGIAFPRTNDGGRFNLDVFAGLAARTLSQEATDRVREAGMAWTETEPGIRTPGGWSCIVHRWIDQKVVLDCGGFELKLYLAVRPLPFLLGALARAGGR